MHLFYSSCSSSALASDAERRIVDHAIAHPIGAVYRLSSNTPLFVRGSISFYIVRRAKKKAKIAKIKTAHSKSLLNVRSVRPGSFSALATDVRVTATRLGARVQHAATIAASWRQGITGP